MAGSMSASARVRNRISRSTGMSNTSHGSVKVPAALALAAVCMFSVPDTRAENECGPPEAGQEVVCSPSTYDPSGGNVFYSYDENGMDETSGDFTIRLTEDLSINYDRERPGDDVWGFPPDPESRDSGAVWISPGEFGEYAGDVSLYSSADVTSNARAIFAGHYGQSGALRLEITGGAITTTGAGSHAIRGYRHPGSGGELDIIVRDVTIDTTAADDAFGVSATHRGEGDLDVHVQDSAISTTGDSAFGIIGFHTSTGDVTIVGRTLTVETKSDGGVGLFGAHIGAGDVDIDARGLTVSAAGDHVDGIRGEHRGQGDIDIHLQDSAIEVMGTVSPGIISFHSGEGDINVNVQGGSITVNALESSGVSTHHFGKGAIKIDLRDVDVVAEGSSTDGIAAWHKGDGNLAVDVLRGRITTRGASSDGIFGYQLNPTDDEGNPLTDADNNVVQVTGDIAIDMTGGMINTDGRGSHGIHALHESGRGEIRIAVDGGLIHASGPDASGIKVSRLGEDGSAVFAAGMGADGYRLQTVTVNGPVTGGSGADAAGVLLVGGGKVVIDPRGSVGAASGIAIRAAGGVPRLHVDLNLAGRRVGTVLQEGEIRNDGGETTLRVNGVPLHDGVAGATGRTVLNGAWDLTLRASDAVAGRDFSAQDFTETYAPRAAVYEALPGLLLRLHSRGPGGERLTVPGSPAWVRVAGGGGRYTPVQASVGASYDYRRVEVEAGLDVELGPRLTGTLSVRHVYGSGDVSSPTGGGKITAQGLGGAVGVAWQGPQGYYFRGRVSVMDYDVDLTSDRRGTLIKDASAVGHSLGFETGRRFTLSERIKLTPRVWVTRSKIDLGFTDAVQSRLWAEDSDRLTAGTGLVAETERIWDDGAQAFAGAAPGGYDLAGDRPGLVRCQVAGQVADLGAVHHPADVVAARRVRGEVVSFHLADRNAQLRGPGFQQARRALGAGGAWVDAVDRDAEAAQLHCQRLGQVHHRDVAGAAAQVAGGATVAAADVDDAAPALFLQEGNCRPRAAQRAHVLHIEIADEGIFVDGVNWPYRIGGAAGQ